MILINNTKREDKLTDIKPHILSLFPEQLEEILLSWGEKKYRISQIFDWIYQKYALSFDEMTTLSKDLRQKLNDHFDFNLPEIDIVQKSADRSEKFRLKLSDGYFIEMVFMPNEKKNTLCISSQVGCARNCQFCATAKMGLIRQLTPEEILGQVLIAQKQFPDQRITNIVLMGMGEPLDNYDNVVHFIRLMQSEKAFSFSPRRMTLSTCGVVPGINKLADSGIKIKLAVSLNSAINVKRNELMPINQLYSLEELKKSVLDFRKKTTFRITFEYIMIKNFNMSHEDVKALIKFAGDISCKINLIKWNHVPGLSWLSPDEKDIAQFIEQLSCISAAITLRQSRGEDIAAACGQLAGNQSQKF